MVDKIKKLLLTNLDKVFLIVMGLAAVALIFMVFNESMTTAPDVDQIQKQDPTIHISNLVDDPVHKEHTKPFVDVQEIVSPWKEMEEAVYYELVEYNMFDPLEVGQSEEREEKARALVVEAEGLVDSGDIEAAREKLKEALKSYYNFAPALEVMQKIEDLESGSAEGEGEEAVEAAEGEATPAP